MCVATSFNTVCPSVSPRVKLQPEGQMVALVNVHQTKTLIPAVSPGPDNTVRDPALGFGAPNLSLSESTEVLCNVTTTCCVWLLTFK
jgi:hypothetical protein